MGEIVIVTDKLRGRDAGLATVAIKADVAVRLRPIAWARAAVAVIADAALIVRGRDAARAIVATTAEAALRFENLLCPRWSVGVIAAVAVSARTFVDRADSAPVAALLAEMDRTNDRMRGKVAEPADAAESVTDRTEARAAVARAAEVAVIVAKRLCPLSNTPDTEDDADRVRPKLTEPASK